MQTKKIEIQKCRVGILLVMTLILISGLISSTAEPAEKVPMQSFTKSSDTNTYDGTISIGINTYNYLSADRSEGAGEYGSFEVTKPSSGDDQIIDFMIMDEENFEKWENGESANGYHVQESVSEYSFAFRYPHASTWYLVWRNRALFTSKEVDATFWLDKTAPEIDMNLDTGASYSGIKEITVSATDEKFDVEKIELYIGGSRVETVYDDQLTYNWNTKDYANDDYAIEARAYDNVGNSGSMEKVVTVSNPVSPGDSTTDDPNDPGANDPDTGSFSLSPGFILAVPILLAIIIGAAIANSRGEKEDQAEKVVPPLKEDEIVAQSAEGKSDSEIQQAGNIESQEDSTKDSVHSREVIKERFLVICPYCGTKNEQGVNKCRKCGAEL